MTLQPYDPPSQVMSKHSVVRQKQVEHVKSEKSVLEVSSQSDIALLLPQRVNHPFLLELLWSYQDSRWCS